jgi:UDP-glucose 4-epimerase
MLFRPLTNLINNSSRILVTGGSGFIGQHVILELLSRGCTITVIDNNDRPFAMIPADFRGQITRYSGRIADTVLLRDFSLREFDYIFHLAGKSNVQFSVTNPLADFEYGVRDTVTLLEQLKNISDAPLLIFPSSAAVYGEPDSMPIRESDATVPISPYGVGKLASENYISVFAKLFNLRALVFRPFSIYGPGLCIYDTISKLARDDKQLLVPGTGFEQRDFLHVKDLVQLFVLGCNQDVKPGECHIINAATGHSTGIYELIDLIVASMNMTPEIKYTGMRRPGDPERWVVDVSKAKQLGFCPTWTIENGIADVLKWFGRASDGSSV